MTLQLLQTIAVHNNAPNFCLLTLKYEMPSQKCIQFHECYNTTYMT